MAARPDTANARIPVSGKAENPDNDPHGGGKGGRPVRSEARLWPIAIGCAIVAALGMTLAVTGEEMPPIAVGMTVFSSGTVAAFVVARAAVRRRRLWRGGVEARRLRAGSAINLSPHGQLLKRPLLLCCGGLALAAVTFISISGDPNSSLRHAKVFWYGLAGVLIVSGSAWAALAARGQRRVRLHRRGMTVDGVVIPAAAIRGLGIMLPVDDPMVTVWYDTGAADLRDARVSPDGTAMLPLTRVALLRSGRLEDVRLAAEQFGGWRVAERDGSPMPERDAEPSVFAADILTFDGRTYRDGTTPVAFMLEKGRTTRQLIYGFFAHRTSMNNVHRTLWLRDRWYEPLIVINRPRAIFNDRIAVMLPDGTPLGSVRERGVIGRGVTGKWYELRDPEGRCVATVRRNRGGSGHPRFDVIAPDGTEIAVLTGRASRVSSAPDDLPGSATRLRLTSDSTGPLRMLTVSLPAVIQVASDH